jgi:hypothetical protein
VSTLLVLSGVTTEEVLLSEGNNIMPDGYTDALPDLLDLGEWNAERVLLWQGWLFIVDAVSLVATSRLLAIVPFASGHVIHFVPETVLD